MRARYDLSAGHPAERNDDRPRTLPQSRKLLKETATSGPDVTERDTWQQRQALVHAILALAAASAGDAHAWRRVLDPEPSPEPQERDIAVPQDS
jgi:hypothetical protein